MNNLDKIHQLVSSKDPTQNELGYILLITNLDTFEGPFSKEDKYTFLMIYELMSSNNKLFLIKHALINKLDVDLLCGTQEEYDKIIGDVLLPIITEWRIHPVVAIKKYTKLKLHTCKNWVDKLYPNWLEEWGKRRPKS